jgi:hypothetical protein
MPGEISSMAVLLEETVSELAAEDRLRWPNALNDANYYHEAETDGFYDGIAACLDALADRFENEEVNGRNAASFVRLAAKELWELEGEGRRWNPGEKLLIATAMLHLVGALEIDSRRFAKKRVGR